MNQLEKITATRQRINALHMENGVRILDPATTYIDESVTIAENTTIYPGAILEGNCVIESGAFIGAYVHLTDTHICANARILSHCVMNQAKVGENSQVGPFAYLRPKTSVGDNCRVGNFVEIKNATLGNYTTAAHLAYIGDATIGNHVNFSCGAITANYNGKIKSQTIIKDNAFIGSNANLIAPVEIGEWAFVAAGSTINKNLPDSSFAIARVRQETKENWDKDPRRNA